MSAPVVLDLNASEINRDTICEVKIAGVYTPFAALKNFDPTTDDANMEAENRYSDGGYNRSNKTGTGWNATLTVAYASLVSDPTSLDPALQFCIDKEGKLGVAAEADFRFYEFNPSDLSPRAYARQGTATVAVKLPGGDANGNKEVTITLTGQGKLNPIAHPYPHGATVPTVAGLNGNPLAVAGGTPFRVVGAGFTGATAVTIGGTAATSFKVWADGEITGVAAAHAAGTGLPVVVTNPTGASTTGTGLATYA